MSSVNYAHDNNGVLVDVGPLVEATAELRKWIDTNIPRFIHEKSVPDLWQMAATGNAITSLVGTDDTPFNSSEREQLRLAVDELRKFIETSFEANEQQKRLVEQKLDILETALAHMGRMSWFTFVLGTLINIGSALYLTNGQGRTLLQFGRQVFEGCKVSALV